MLGTSQLRHWRVYRNRRGLREGAVLKTAPILSGWPILGVLPGFRKDGPAFLLKAARDHGDIVHLRLGPQSVYLVGHPDWVRDVLVTNQNNFTKSRMLERARVLLGDGLLTSEGDHHRRQRRLIQPAFHRERLMGYGRAMIDCTARVRERWRAGETLDMSVEMARLTLAIVARTLFSADVDTEADQIGTALTDVIEMFQTLLLPFSEWLEKLPLPSMRRFERARATLDQTIFRLIAEHRASGDMGDLLSMLLAAQDESDGSGMTDQEVRDEALTLFLAGHETTANALTWTWYLLSQNPDAEAKLHAELDRVLGDRLPAVEDLPALRYSEYVIAEALRLYPPAWTFGRRVREDYKVGEYEIPARSIVLISPYVVHRDPRWFPDPEKFDPDRWLPEEVEKRPKFSFVPFGGGARVCIGERFAWMEGVLALATLASRWKLQLEPGHRVATKAMITLRPKYGMRMRIISRRS